MQQMISLGLHNFSINSPAIKTFICDDLLTIVERAKSDSQINSITPSPPVFDQYSDGFGFA
jgi:hypothetical protein